MNLSMADHHQLSEPGGDEDTRLLVAARRDPTAFADLYTRNADQVVAFFYRRTACAVTSHDLTAETFAQAFAALHRYRPATAPGVAWIFGIAHNLHRQWLRKAVVTDKARRRLQLATPEVGAEDLERVEALVDLAPLRASLHSALHQLSDGVRDAVVLRIAEDLPYPDVAEALGCSVGAARVRVSRGLDHLYRLMEQT